MAETEARASHDLAEFRATVARATNEKVRLFRELGRLVLDTSIQDTILRRAIYRRISRDQLQEAVDEADKIARPDDDNYFDFLETRYSYLRQFVPALLVELERLIDERLPYVKLSELLIEVDHWTGFTDRCISS